MNRWSEIREGRLILVLLVIFVSEGSVRAGAAFQDWFGRDVAGHGITLVDWEGYMANPAIEFLVRPPAGAAFPVDVRISATEPRLSFDLPSQAGRSGPSKRLRITADQPTPVSVTIFPARQKLKLESSLDIVLTDARGWRTELKVPIHVIVSPSRPKPDTYPITVDFSQDQTGFFKDAGHRAIAQQAVQDWAFYFEKIPLLEVGAQAEKTFIFEPNGFVRSNLHPNAQAYTGYLLYLYGIDGPEIRSGGEPSSAGGFQVSDGKTLRIRRSGGVELETKGNYNLLGWLPDLPDADWWRATNLGDVPNDLYSIVHHESGHALIFNPANPRFHRSGVLDDPAIVAYLGRGATTDKTDHLDGIVDPASLRGAFGNEYHGRMPLGRWLITKLDLLCAQAVGYRLRKVDALTPVAITTDHLPDATAGRPYRAAMVAEGGVPFYDWTLAAGQLPAGLVLDRFTGEISGTASRPGTAVLNVKLRDYTKDSAGVTRSLTLTVRP